MKDDRGRVSYIGKALNTQPRLEITLRDKPPRICERRTSRGNQDLDFIVTDSRSRCVAAGGPSSRRPASPIRAERRQDLSVPQIFIREFPRVEFLESRDRVEPGVRTVRNAKRLRGAYRPATDLSVPRALNIKADERWRWFRPCLLAHPSVHRAVQSKDQSREYRRDIRRLRMFLDSKKEGCSGTAGNAGRRQKLKFERRHDCASVKSLENLNLRGDLRQHAARVFQVDPKRGCWV